MILVLWSQAYAGSVIEPEPSPLGLSFRHFQAFFTPDPFGVDLCLKYSLQ